LGASDGSDTGNDTDDYIFLLSLEEVVRYFGDSGQLANGPSENRNAIDDQYNEARIAYDFGGWWWLRSPGGGDIGVSGTRVDDDYHGVRPALWINL
jgi:hypothetical protein